MLAYTACSLLIASVAEIVIQGYAFFFDKYIPIIPLRKQHSNPDATQEASPGSQNTWSSGSAFSGIVILQLSCVFQPSGSFIFEGAIGTWRFSPLYCLLDIIAIYRQLIRILLKYECSLSTACLSVSAARYRSYRNIVGAGERHDLGSTVLQDIADVGRVIRQRRLMAICMGLIGVFQFTKVMAVQGPPETVAVGFVLACIYFSYWATNEAIAAVVRLAPVALQDDTEMISMCLHVRPRWFCMSSGLREYMASVWHFAAVGILAAALFGAGFGEMELGGSKASYVVNVLCVLFLYGFPALIVLCHLWPCGTFDNRYQKPKVFLFVWFTYQGLQTCGLILLYYMCAYDSTKTTKPGWTDWLGKF